MYLTCFNLDSFLFRTLAQRAAKRAKATVIVIEDDPTEIYTLSLHDALPIYHWGLGSLRRSLGQRPEKEWVQSEANQIQDKTARIEELQVQ